MENTRHSTTTRTRGVLMLFCAAVLFLAGLLLLFAPARNRVSRCVPHHFHRPGDGWIMGSQSYQANFLAGG